MTVIAIAPMFNSPGKKDASGAFLPEARLFAKLHGGRLMLFDNRKPEKARFTEVIDLLTGQRADCVAFFCHGFKSGLQVGANMRNVHVLAATLRDCGVRTVPLYACDAARDLDGERDDDNGEGPGGAGGFASALSAALPGVVVDAHTTAAHTTRNPHVRRFRGGGDGEWLVTPGSVLWRPWRDALRDDREFRLSFPLWSEDEIRDVLVGRAA